jgi:hypothetical protein
LLGPGLRFIASDDEQDTALTGIEEGIRQWDVFRERKKAKKKTKNPIETQPVKSILRF